MLITVFDIDTVALLMGRVSCATAKARIKHLQKLTVIDRGRNKGRPKINVWIADDVLELIEEWKYNKGDVYEQSKGIGSQTEKDLQCAISSTKASDLGISIQEQAEDAEVEIPSKQRFSA